MATIPIPVTLDANDVGVIIDVLKENLEVWIRTVEYEQSGYAEGLVAECFGEEKAFERDYHLCLLD